ncbi:polymerase [Klebsiella pneumoniae]|uniref:Polymerase n=1 Tax=Klebsiella pneumoniae TaxID=573 RepID=A0A377XHZ1_KLEPN|nr:polymerase [Klebsiella pneumoniae]
MGALLKGGIVGLLLLLAIIACGLWQAWRKRHTDSRYSLAILFYALVFMASQGMFIISNPRETWVLFWLPLGIALSKGVAEKTLTKRAVSGPFYINFLNQLRAATSRSACSLITGHTDSIATSATFASSQTICFALS